MIIEDVLNNIRKEFRTEEDRKLFPCHSCGEPGLVEIKGAVNCYECGNEITLCRNCACNLVDNLLGFLDGR